MEYRELGGTGIRVSRLCFGSLTIGPLQAKLPLEKGTRVIESAIEWGVNFIDTAELYNNYEYIKPVLKGRNRQIAVATKSYAYTKDRAVKSLEIALREIDRDYIDIFLMHEQESELTIRGHEDAFNQYIKAKDKGQVRAVGISTHTVRGVNAAADIPEIDVIHPIINYKGIGIQDGTLEDMTRAIKKASEKGKGIYGMKPLGGGNLNGNVVKCLEFVINMDYLDSIAVGMQSEEEVFFNACIFNGEKIPDDISKKLSKTKRTILIDTWCEGCGKCVDICSYGAVSIIDKKAAVDKSKCVLCGYCGSHCPEFCIKII